MIPNNNQEVLSMLAEKLRKKNRGRNKARRRDRVRSV